MTLRNYTTSFEFINSDSCISVHHGTFVVLLRTAKVLVTHSANRPSDTHSTTYQIMLNSPAPHVDGREGTKENEMGRIDNGA